MAVFFIPPLPVITPPEIKMATLIMTLPTKIAVCVENMGLLEGSDMYFMSLHWAQPSVNTIIDKEGLFTYSFKAMDTSPLLLIIAATLFISILALSGVFFLFWSKMGTGKATYFLLSFAAGTMLAVSFLDLLPEAAEAAAEGTNIFAPTLLGVIAFFFIERFVLWFHHHDELHEMKPSAILILLGDGLHNFIDGVAIAAAFLVNPALGFSTTLAIAAHEIPQEVADFSVLVHGGMKRSKALCFNFISGLTALIGALAGFYFLEKLENSLPVFLAFTAGMFIYIACSDLIPEIHKSATKQKNWAQFLPFLLGIVVLWVLVKTLEG